MNTDQFISATTASRTSMLRKAKSALENAVTELRSNEPNGTGSATPAQILAVAEKFEIWGGPSELEGAYLDDCDKAANE